MATEATGQLADVMRRLKAAALELEELEEAPGDCGTLRGFGGDEG